MGLRINGSGYISYSNFHLPPAPWALCYKRVQIGEELNTDNVNLTLSGGGTSISWAYNKFGSSRGLALLYSSSTQNFRLPHTFGAGSVSEAVFIDYTTSGNLRVWNISSNTIQVMTSQTVSSNLSEISKLLLTGYKTPITVSPHECTIWSDYNFNNTDIYDLYNNYPNLHFKRNHLYFYERYFTTFNNPYRLGHSSAIEYNNVDETGDADRSIFPHIFGYNFSHYPVITGPTTHEYTINISNSVGLSEANTTGSSTNRSIESLIRIVSYLINNESTTLVWENIVRFVNDLRNQIKRIDIRNHLFLIESWVSEYPEIGLSMRGDVVELIVSMLLSIDVTRYLVDYVIVGTEAEAYVS